MELFVELGIKEIASIINRMGLITDTNVNGEVEVNGNKYYYSKEGNTFVIGDETGKGLRIGINYSEQMGKDAYNRDVKYVKHDVSIDYLLSDEDYINLSNDIALDPGYESFENIQRHDILRGVRSAYCNKFGKEVATFGLDLDRICLKENNNIYEFNKDGIKCGNKIISIDGNNLVSISGEEIPNIETVLSFGVTKEQDKVRDIIAKENLHPFTKEALEDTIRLLDRKNRFAKNIVNYYNTDIKEVRKAIEIRNKIQNSVKGNVIDKDVIEKIAEDFYNKTDINLQRKKYL